MIRLLLPFTHGVEVSAIIFALALARRLDATLVALSLIQLPEAAKKGPRWEDIQQSKDFLEVVGHKAARSGVSVERIELRTHDPVRSIRSFAQEMECAGILLFERGGTGVLLATGEVKQLLAEQHIPLYLVSLLPSEHRFPRPGWLSGWLNR